MVAFSDELQKLVPQVLRPPPCSFWKGPRLQEGVAKKGLKYTAIGAGGVGARRDWEAYLMTRPDPNTSLLTRRTSCPGQ